MADKIGKCETKKFCCECPDNAKGCYSEKGYCITTKYCEECSDCGV